MKESSVLHCSRCDIDFTEETAGAVHQLTHEVASLRMSLDEKMDNLTRTITQVSNRKN